VFAAKLLDKLGNNNLVYPNPQTSSQGGCIFPKRLGTLSSVMWWKTS